MVFASGEENVHAVSAVTSGARATLNLWLTFDEALSATRAGDEFEEHRGAIREPRKNARGEKKSVPFFRTRRLVNVRNANDETERHRV